jgi:hypothetical protein
MLRCAQHGRVFIVEIRQAIFVTHFASTRLLRPLSPQSGSKAAPRNDGVS